MTPHGICQSCEPVPLEWQQDTKIGCKACVFLRRRTRQYRATKTNSLRLWYSTQKRRSKLECDSLLWIESTEGLGKSKLFWETKSWFFRLWIQGSLRGNQGGLFDGECQNSGLSSPLTFLSPQNPPSHSILTPYHLYSFHHICDASFFIHSIIK